MKNKIKKIIITVNMILFAAIPIPVHAASDPTTGVSRLTTIITSVVSAAGIIFLIWSVVNLGIAIKRRDPASAGEAILGVIGGIMIACAPWIAQQLAQ